MKKIALAVLMLLTARVCIAQYKPTDNGSSVQFVIKNIGINVPGSFKGLQGIIIFDPEHLASASFDVSIDANTINTDNSMRDDHLRKDTYFDVKNYPRILFVSTKVTPSTRRGIYFVFGKLTIKGKTKDILFPFTVSASNGGYMFKGNFKINRKDFNVGGTSIISDSLQVNLNILAKQ